MVKAKEIVTPMDSIPYAKLNMSEKNARKAALASKLAEVRERDSQIVRCRFKNYEMPGADLRFAFKKYKGDQIEKYHFLDGHVYSVPIAVIKHINKDCFYPLHKHAMDENGQHINKISAKYQRFELIPLEFIDTEDLTAAASDLTTVERV